VVKERGEVGHAAGLEHLLPCERRRHLLDTQHEWDG
jgi:hypothetical protein